MAAGVIVIRRWLQFTHPDVWVEDGTQVLPSYVQHGWLGLFLPVEGYLVIPAKLVSFTALQISFLQYARVSTLIATAVQALCVAVVASAPTVLPARPACALAIVCVPTGTEVFALPIYTFWWTTLLVVVALFWQVQARQWPRLLCLTIGALSSPVIIGLAPAFILRALVERRMREMVATMFALAFGSIQALVMYQERARQTSLLDALMRMDVLISKYLGTAFYGLDLHGAGVFGIVMVAAVAVGFLVLPYQERFGYVLLMFCLAVAVASSVSRVPVTAPHPLLAGPRYFFYPTIFLLWVLIWIAAKSPRPSALAAALLIGAYAPSLAKDFTYATQIPKERWKRQVVACEKSDAYTFEIQFGTVRWLTTMRGVDCRRLVDRSLLG